MAGLRASDWRDNFLLVIDESLDKPDDDMRAEARLERRLVGETRPLPVRQGASDPCSAVGEWSIYVQDLLMGVLKQIKERNSARGGDA